nr:AAA family ATPase [Halococcus morrhuae]
MYDERGEVPSGYIPNFNAPLKTAIESVLPGIEYKGVSIEDNVYQVMFENRAGERVQFDHLSSGEKDAIAMLFLLVEKQIENLVSEVREVDSEQEDLILLIDSPESHLHPAMQSRFFNYLQDILKSSEGENLDLQVMMCTHSQMILNDCEYVFSAVRS